MKASKPEAHYRIGMAKSHCGKSFKDDKDYCQHYRPNTEYEGVVWLIPVSDSGRAVLDRRERLPLYFAEDHPA